MKRGFAMLAALVLMPALALAQTLPPTVLAPVVPSGKLRQLGFFATLNPDCTGAGDIDARIVKQAQNGIVELEPGQGFTLYPEKNPRSACNTKQVQGIKVKYTSKDGFIGKDSFEVEFLTPAGSDVTWKYSVTVK